MNKWTGSEFTCSFRNQGVTLYSLPYLPETCWTLLIGLPSIWPGNEEAVCCLSEVHIIKQGWTNDYERSQFVQSKCQQDFAQAHHWLPGFWNLSSSGYPKAFPSFLYKSVYFYTYTSTPNITLMLFELGVLFHWDPRSALFATFAAWLKNLYSFWLDIFSCLSTRRMARRFC